MKELGVQMIAAYSPQARGSAGAELRRAVGGISKTTRADLNWVLR
jgi:hypothetical protein